MSRGIQFAVLIPRACMSCKRADPPGLSAFPPIGEHALLCSDCCRRPEYELITKTDALNEYKLQDHDLVELAFVKRMSKKKFFMKLYLRSQIQGLAAAKHGPGTIPALETHSAKVSNTTVFLQPKEDLNVTAQHVTAEPVEHGSHAEEQRSQKDEVVICVNSEDDDACEKNHAEGAIHRAPAAAQGKNSSQSGAKLRQTTIQGMFTRSKQQTAISANKTRTVASRSTRELELARPTKRNLDASLASAPPDEIVVEDARAGQQEDGGAGAEARVHAARGEGSPPAAPQRRTEAAGVPQKKRKLLLSQMQARRAALLGGSSFKAQHAALGASASSSQSSPASAAGDVEVHPLSGLCDTLCTALPDELLVRCDVAAAGRSVRQGAGEDGFVLYVMQTALRVHDNPALEAAQGVAEAVDGGLFVVMPLFHGMHNASPRHWKFVLEGVSEVQEALNKKGVASSVLLDGREEGGREGWASLLQLCSRAAVVVMEDMPTLGYRRVMWRVAQETRANLVVVDTACTLPMKVVGKAYHSASAFAKATEGKRREHAPSHLPPPPAAADRPGSAGSIMAWMQREDSSSERGVKAHFVPHGVECVRVEGEAGALECLASSKGLDPMPSAVDHTIGGSSHGYRRWAQFASKGLGLYAKRRNNACLRSGVSRMSAYLHYGMVSARYLAQQARQKKASKFEQELIVWRELCFVYCKYTPSYGYQALPAWARGTLCKHAEDRRPSLPSQADLAAGRTGNKVWDAMQTSLVRHGELHNNLRMTWGKAFLNWTPHPSQALDAALGINDRFALDGGDPCSVGGVFWCFGLFDGPKGPERPIIGTLRPRPTDGLRRLPFI